MFQLNDYISSNSDSTWDIYPTLYPNRVSNIEYDYVTNNLIQERTVSEIILKEYIYRHMRITLK